jgi:magnesium chelatase family protein
VRAYLNRLSGPLLDRIDLHVDVPALPYRELAHAEPGEPTAAVRDRVVAARAHQQARGPRCNARVSSTELRRVAILDGPAHALLERAAARLGLSARAITRVRRVARTIADLAGSPAIATTHLAEALQYRVLDQPTT